MRSQIPPDWREALGPALLTPAFADLEAQVLRERTEHPGAVFPESDQVFAALWATPLDRVRAVIVGQDPYPTRGHAHGLAFSVPDGTKALPGSLRNILAELRSDVGGSLGHGSLMPWAEQGVLLLNTVLTVREGEAFSHRNIGWQGFTKAILELVSAKEEEVVPILWGRAAREVAAGAGFLGRSWVVGAHPSPLSAYRGFNGSRPFSRANDILRRRGAQPIEWTL